MYRMTLSSLPGGLWTLLLLTGPAWAQGQQKSLPEPCGGAERSLAEFDLEQYRSVFFDADRQQIRSELGVERLESGARVGVVDEADLCARLIRRVLDTLDEKVWETPERPSEQTHRKDIHYEFFRYGPYLVALVAPPEDPDVEFIGNATLLVFRADDLTFLGSFLG